MLIYGLRELQTIHSPSATSTCIVEYCSHARRIGIMLIYGLRELQTIHSPSATSTCIVEYCSRAHSIGKMLNYGLCELKKQFTHLPLRAQDITDAQAPITLPILSEVT